MARNVIIPLRTAQERRLQEYLHLLGLCQNMNMHSLTHSLTHDLSLWNTPRSGTDLS